FCFFVLLPALFFFAYKLAVNIKIRPEPRIAADLSGRERKPGQVAGLYLTVYSVFRFIIEFYRGDEARGVWGGVTTSQWISLFLLPIGIILLIGNIPLIRPTNPALVTPEGFILVPDEDLDRAPDEAPAEEESGEDAPEDAEEKDDHK
ncbi:MAG: prolipoprotein diacylglyceryl transferase, partial [Oscillospiraceae bacterium]|nr:prolipoprotein diacylglyceryl transferase [Oscillospiraceae bacterium]